jgi:hypothetical protein
VAVEFGVATSVLFRKIRKLSFFSVVWGGKEKKENGAAGAPGRQGRLKETWDDTVDTW